MRFTILIPHYKTGKMTAYCVSQLMKFKGKHEIQIIVIDNGQGVGKEYFTPCDKFGMDCDMYYIPYPSHLMQSHGIAFDYALEQMYNSISDYFITVETDSFPTQDNWLDYYENLINEGYDMAGSRLRLSGGEYIHPAGAMYKKSNWLEAKQNVGFLNHNYHYYPNMLMKDGFPCHIMKFKAGGVDDLYGAPFHHSYRCGTSAMESQKKSYLPIAESVFHNGMGFKQESYLTYGQRTIDSEKDSIIKSEIKLDEIQPLIYRMGYEPGQWFAYWHYATNKKVYQIGTEIVWMPNRVNQQQEYTMMDNGFKHLWGVTAYGGGEKNEATEDIYNRKKQLMEELYNSIT